MSDNLEQLASLMTPGLNTNAPNVAALLAGMAAQLDRVDPEALGLADQFSVTLATGAALDLHGADWSVPRRPGETDATYKTRLLATVPLFSQGPTVAALAAAVMPFTGVAPRIFERGVNTGISFPMAFPITFGADTSSDLLTIDVWVQNPNGVAYQQSDVVAAVTVVKRVTTTVVLWWDSGGSTTVSN